MRERIKGRLRRDITTYGRMAVAFAATMLAMNVLIGHTCTFRLMAGIPCPWCGITRATALLLTGHFSDSWQMHPMAVFYILLGLLFLVYRYVGRLGAVFWISLAAVFAATVVVYIVRFPEMFPGSPPFRYDPENLFARLFLRTIN